MFKDTPKGETHHCTHTEDGSLCKGCLGEQESIMEEFKETLEYVALCTLYGKKTTKGIADFFLSKFTTMIEEMEKEIFADEEMYTDDEVEHLRCVLQKYKKLLQ